MAEDPRIEQFKQMAEADPDNELGHFSLGKLYLEKNLSQEAVGPLRRALDLNPNLSKAYQFLGQAYEQAGHRERAVETVTHGVTVADRQGDRMPRDAMVKMLEDWGAPVPSLESAGSRPTAGKGPAAAQAGFQCSRCSRPTGKLQKPPFKGPLGQKIMDNVCETCWREWVAMGTKVINELGLVLSQPAGQEAYDQYMIEFLQLEDR